MSISSATLLIFIFMLPGFFFLLGVHSNSRISITGLQNNLLWDVSFLLAVSILVNIISVEVYFDWFLLPNLNIKFDPVKLVFIDTNYNTIECSKFIYENKRYVLIFIVLNISLSYVLGKAAITLNNMRILRSGLFYGPFYDLVSGRLPIIYTSVITKISHEGKILMYSALLEDIVFSSDKKIDYVVLAYPVRRFLMDIGISPPAIKDGVDLEAPDNIAYAQFLINGADIENIYFTRYQSPKRFAAALAIFARLRARMLWPTQ